MEQIGCWQHSLRDMISNHAFCCSFWCCLCHHLCTTWPRRLSHCWINLLLGTWPESPINLHSYTLCFHRNRRAVGVSRYRDVEWLEEEYAPEISTHSGNIAQEPWVLSCCSFLPLECAQPVIICVSDPEHKPSTLFELFYAWKVLSVEPPAPNKEMLCCQQEYDLSLLSKQWKTPPLSWHIYLIGLQPE